MLFNFSSGGSGGGITAARNVSLLRKRTSRGLLTIVMYIAPTEYAPRLVARNLEQSVQYDHIIRCTHQSMFIIKTRPLGKLTNR